MLMLVMLVEQGLAELIVITSAEENTSPVFEVYDTAQDTVATVQKVGREECVVPDCVCRCWGWGGQTCCPLLGLGHSLRGTC